MRTTTPVINFKGKRVSIQGSQENKYAVVFRENIKEDGKKRIRIRRTENRHALDVAVNIANLYLHMWKANKMFDKTGKVINV